MPAMCDSAWPIADYLAARPAELQPSYRLRVTWNGSEVLARDVTPADAFGGGATRVRVPARDLRPGDNRLAIERTGAGTVYWAVEARVLVPSPGPPTGASCARHSLAGIGKPGEPA